MDLATRGGERNLFFSLSHLRAMHREKGQSEEDTHVHWYQGGGNGRRGSRIFGPPGPFHSHGCDDASAKPWPRCIGRLESARGEGGVGSFFPDAF